MTRAERIYLLRDAIADVIAAIVQLDQLALRRDSDVLGTVLARLQNKLDRLRAQAAEAEAA